MIRSRCCSSSFLLFLIVGTVSSVEDFPPSSEEQCKRLLCKYEYCGPGNGLSAAQVTEMGVWANDEVNRKISGTDLSATVTGITYNDKTRNFFGAIRVCTIRAWCQPENRKFATKPGQPWGELWIDCKFEDWVKCRSTGNTPCDRDYSKLL